MTIGTLSRVGLLPQKRERLLFFGTKVNDPLIFLHVCVCHVAKGCCFDVAEV